MVEHTIRYPIHGPDNDAGWRTRTDKRIFVSMGNNIFSFFAARTEDEAATAVLHETYHENSKLSSMPEQWSLGLFGPSLTDPNSCLLRASADLGVAETEAFVAEGGKSYPLAPRITLPDPPPWLASIPLHSALAQRYSSRAIPAGPVDPAMLSAIFLYAGGWNESRTGKADHTTIRYRYAPSAGRLFPLELYAAMPAAGQPGQYAIYHYQPNDHALEQINRTETDRIRQAFVLCPDPLPPLVLFITAIVKRQAWKYGDRAYRYALLEAGHVGQNIALVTAALGVDHCPIAGYYDDETHDILDIDGVSEVTLYCFLAGRQIENSNK